jgi:hypothetical protein
MDLPSGSISHAVSPVARVLPDLRAGGGLGRPCGNSGSYFVRLPRTLKTTEYGRLLPPIECLRGANP